MKKTIHISVESIYYWICWGIILLPPSISHLSSLLDKVITCLGFFLILLLVLIKNIQIVKSKALLFLVLFVFWCIGVTFIQSPGKLASLLFTDVLPIIGIYLLLQHSTQAKENRSFMALYGVCRFYIAIEFLSMLVFPGGIFTSASGASVARAQWIFGSKNNVALYMIIFVAIIAWYTYCSGKGQKKFVFYALMAFFSIAMRGEDGVQLLAGSSTGIVAILATLCMIGYFYFTRKTGLHAVGNRTFLIAIGLVYFAILAGGTLPFLQKIVVDIFHKTPTYSGRLSIWQTTISNIMDSVWVGHGEVDFYSTVYIDQQLTYTSYTYNAILKVILNYGVIGLALLLIFLFSIRNLNAFQCKLLFSGFVGLLFVGMMNELEIKWMVFFPLLISCVGDLETENVKETVREKEDIRLKLRIVERGGKHL